MLQLPVHHEGLKTPGVLHTAALLQTLVSVRSTLFTRSFPGVTSNK